MHVAAFSLKWAAQLIALYTLARLCDTIAILAIYGWRHYQYLAPVSPYMHIMSNYVALFLRYGQCNLELSTLPANAKTLLYVDVYYTYTHISMQLWLWITY